MSKNFEGWKNVILNIGSALPGVTPVIEKGLGVITFINPLIKEEMWQVTGVLTAIAGVLCLNIGGRVANFIMGCGALCVAVISVVLMLAMTRGLLGLDGAGQSFLIRGLYLTFFLAVGIAIGSLLGLFRTRG